VISHHQFNKNTLAIAFIQSWSRRYKYKYHKLFVYNIVLLLVVYLFSKSFGATLICSQYKWKINPKGEYNVFSYDTTCLQQAIIWGDFVKFIEEIIGKKLAREVMGRETCGFLPAITR
jgi:uncharacterized protein VirK/YbjX